MRKHIRYFVVVLLLLFLLYVSVVFLQNTEIAVLSPKGIIASKQRDLLVVATGLMLLVVVPVILMAFAFAWKYREGNKKSRYTPDWDHNNVDEAIWWGIPFVIIFILAGITWRSTHDLDPYKPLISDRQAIKVQVVALQWKWLFIYPDYDIATVNFVQFPEKNPVAFEITADAPMNSFWIPQLAGQVYSMNGMVTKLHIEADEQGDYEGLSSNISGLGFAGMKFIARASSDDEFLKWVESVKQSPHTLSRAQYEMLANPSEKHPVTYYGTVEERLHDQVVMKYMNNPTHSENSKHKQLPYNEHETTQ
jgi:cytochrome o ubiquinol oxidase subunit II